MGEGWGEERIFPYCFQLKNPAVHGDQGRTYGYRVLVCPKTGMLDRKRREVVTSQPINHHPVRLGCYPVVSVDNPSWMIVSYIE